MIGLEERQPSPSSVTATSASGIDVGQMPAPRRRAVALARGGVELDIAPYWRRPASEWKDDRAGLGIDTKRK